MNYLDFYHLKEPPFSLSVDERFYFNSAQHARALVKLKHAVEESRGLGVLVGDLGMGKTTLARKLLEELDEASYEAAMLVVIHPMVTVEWVLQKIAMQVGVINPNGDRSTLIGQIYQRIAEISDSGKKTVVLIDEAHMFLRKEIMEELRGLLNMELDGHKILTFILFGPNETDTCLNLFLPLRQHVAVRCRLGTFAREMTEEYIGYRMDVAGSRKNIFMPSSYEIIHRYSGGVPRLINTICDNAMLEGCLLKKGSIDDMLIQEVVRELNFSPADPQEA